MNKLTLYSALYQLQRRHVVLRPTHHSVALWSAGARVPSVIRKIIENNHDQVRALIANADVRTCPSPTWHRREWYYVGQQTYRCAVCERLAI